MKLNHIPPFYFPTMVMFVDDSTDFLFNLSLQLDAMLAFRLYNSPVDALRHLNSADGDRVPPPADCYSPYQNCDQLSLTHQVIDIDLDKIAREVHNPFRFQQVSVVVVDYHMPGIDGLEFCQRIENPAVKKVLLTGKADEKVAVQAFNEGLIDRFIQKQDADAIPNLNRAITQLQWAYFQQVGQQLVDTLAPRSHAFLRDGAFAGLFRRLCAEMGAVEFYLRSVPEGLLLFDANAQPSLLIVQTGEDLAAFDAVYGAPEEEGVLAGEGGARKVRHFWEDRDVHGQALGNWQTCEFPAQEFRGRSHYYYALVSEPPGIAASPVLSYRSFIEQLDPRGWLPDDALVR